MLYAQAQEKQKPLILRSSKCQWWSTSKKVHPSLVRK